jgi:hypothetical protein
MASTFTMELPSWSHSFQIEPWPGAIIGDLDLTNGSIGILSPWPEPDSLYGDALKARGARYVTESL